VAFHISVCVEGFLVVECEAKEVSKVIASAHPYTVACVCRGKVCNIIGKGNHTNGGVTAVSSPLLFLPKTEYGAELKSIKDTRATANIELAHTILNDNESSLGTSYALDCPTSGTTWAGPTTPSAHRNSSPTDYGTATG
jgi:hypothetical protein